MDDSDLYGGLALFDSLRDFSGVKSGKLLYGYIYGIAVFGSMLLHWIFAMMTPPGEGAEQDQLAQGAEGSCSSAGEWWACGRAF